MKEEAMAMEWSLRKEEVIYSHLVADASEHFTCVLVRLAKLVKSCITLSASLVVGTFGLWVVITAIQCGSGQSVDGFVNGSVSMSVLIAQIVLASAVQVKRGESCHGGKAKEGSRLVKPIYAQGGP
jgi:hypothetical protein